MNIVYPLGDGRFLMLIFKVSAIPNHIGFGRYYEATCEIALGGGQASLLECVLHRPPNRRNVVGDLVTDWLGLAIECELTEEQLASATISIARYGDELSEQDAKLRFGDLAGSRAREL